MSLTVDNHRLPEVGTLWVHKDTEYNTLFYVFNESTVSGIVEVVPGDIVMVVEVNRIIRDVQVEIEIVVLANQQAVMNPWLTAATWNARFSRLYQDRKGISDDSQL